MNIIRGTVEFLNRPVIKENIKNVVGIVSFAFGVIEIVDICRSLKERKITTESCTKPHWYETAKKIIFICARLSIILSGIVSRPGVFIISNLVGRIVPSAFLERIFGPNTTFAVNLWHPRHICSLTAVALAIPALALSIGERCLKAFKKADSDSTLVPKLWFNTLSSRPVIHWGNHLGHLV